MAEAIDQKTRQIAAGLWITGGLTYADVAKEVECSIGALKKWSAEENWPSQRIEYRREIRDQEIKAIQLSGKLLDKALASQHSQDVYAYAAIKACVDRAIQTKLRGAADAEALDPAKILEIKSPQQAIDALQGEIEKRVNLILAGGTIDLKIIKELKASLDLLDRMKGEANRVELFMEFMKVLIEYLGKNDQGALVAIEDNFDEFMAYIRERYKVA